MYTVAAAAARLGLAERTVRKWCKDLGLPKVGRDYVLSDADIERIGSHAKDGPGRPKKAGSA